MFLLSRSTTYEATRGFLPHAGAYGGDASSVATERKLRTNHLAGARAVGLSSVNAGAAVPGADEGHLAVVAREGRPGRLPRRDQRRPAREERRQNRRGSKTKRLLVPTPPSFRRRKGVKSPHLFFCARRKAYAPDRDERILQVAYALEACYPATPSAPPRALALIAKSDFAACLAAKPEGSLLRSASAYPVIRPCGGGAPRSLSHLRVRTTTDGSEGHRSERRLARGGATRLEGRGALGGEGRDPEVANQLLVVLVTAPAGGTPPTFARPPDEATRRRGRPLPPRRRSRRRRNGNRIQPWLVTRHYRVGLGGHDLLEGEGGNDGLVGDEGNTPSCAAAPAPTRPLHAALGWGSFCFTANPAEPALPPWRGVTSETHHPLRGGNGDPQGKEWGPPGEGPDDETPRDFAISEIHSSAFSPQNGVLRHPFSPTGDYR